MNDKFALITGASGLLGSLINAQLQQAGYTTIGLVHHNDAQCHHNIKSLTELRDISRHLNLVINLAGAPVAGGLWTNAYKQKLSNSRVTFTRHLIHELENLDIHVEHFMSSSAIGYYGTGDDDANETSPSGADFSAQLCQQWEAAALEAKQHLNARVTIFRTGLVLTQKGGYLAPLWLSSKFGLSATFGDGQQGISWIDYRDWQAMIAFIWQHKLEGTFNLTAPNPVSQKTFAKTIATHQHRPCWLKIPSWAFKPVGEIRTLFLEGQYVRPNALTALGYEFSYPTLSMSLESLLRR